VREGATNRSIDFLMYLFQVAEENNNTNPIDYLLHSYETRNNQL
jgi:hypothetical protein